MSSYTLKMSNPRVPTVRGHHKGPKSRNHGRLVVKVNAFLGHCAVCGDTISRRRDRRELVYTLYYKLNI